MIRFATFIGIVLCVAGCTSTQPRTTPEKWRGLQTKLRTDPAFRKAAIEDCAGNVDRNTPQQDKQRIAALNHIPLNSFSKTLCTRIWNGVAENRIKYDVYLKLRGDRSTWSYHKALQSMK
ncbi:hypothetical protein MAUB1S_08440 [Mycolicibacterium aubagnense]